MSEKPDTRVPLRTVESIVADGLCIGCGLCQSIATPDAIRIVMSGEGGERPLVLRPLDEPVLRAINTVCPGIRVEGYQPGSEPSVPEIDPIWGPTRQMAIGHAGDPSVRHHASSGGALSALGLHLLARKKVKFILHVAASTEQPLRTVRHLSFDAAQVIEASGSRYGPAAPLIDFREILDRDEPFAFIGKACDISAIRNYARLDPRVDRLLRYTLNFYCGGVSEFGKTVDYVRRIGRTEADISGLRYRGDGCPGEMVMKTHDGSEHRFSYNEMWNDEQRWQLQFRCKICPDALGDLADLSVADVWPGGKPITDEIGFNGFIARTERGQELLDDAVRAGAIVLTEELDYAGLELAQGSQMRKKQGLNARYAAMRDVGIAPPLATGLRLEAAAGMLSDMERRQNHDGMRQRLEQGDNREPVPTL
nr:Coenzyme F420 hydrogenase/dehydrogenase, beta subunit C-terminal domain [uncultured Lichenicoccus sp.]